MKEKLYILLLLLLCIQMPINVWAYVVRGTVTGSDDGEPIIGASVVVKGQKTGALTDLDGNYQINIEEDGPVTLVFSYISMRAVERKVDAKTSVLNVTLDPDVSVLEEVVVVAYGTRKKGTIAGSVSTVDGKAIAEVPAASFDQALQGKATGLTVLSNSGEPSKAASFQIRGTNSINSGTSPLFILDGVPISASDFNAINPADIESVSVLKDASSTSVYGARAANGVVVITSKRGREMGNAKITFRTQLGWSGLAHGNWNLMNTQERIAFEKEVGLDAGQDYDLLSQTDVNWRDLVFRNNAMLQNYDVSINQARDKYNYFVSANYFDQEGIAQSSMFRRYNIHANVESQAKKWLKLGTNTLISYEEAEQADDGAYALYTPISASRFMLPYWNPYRSDGSLATEGSGAWQGTSQNPIEWMANNPLSMKKYKVLSSLFFEIEPIENLKWRTQASADFTHSTSYMQSMPSYATNNGNGGAGRSSSDALGLTITNTLGYNFAICTNHRFNLLLGQEGVNQHSEGFQVVTRGQNNDWLTTVSNGTRASSWNDTTADYAYLSFFGRAEYDYLSRYYLDFSLRADASSRFGSNNRWGEFWSVGAMWNLRQEKWLKEVQWLDDLRLAASTGTSGNSSIPNYDHLALVGGGADYDGTNGIYPMQKGNENLGWERLWSNNIAIHAGFWNRLHFDLEYYYKKTTNMLMYVPVSYSINPDGYQWDNIGGMVNQGVELSMNATALRIQDFQWTVNANISYNHNEITELYNGLDEYEISSSGLKLVKGHSIGEFYINRYAGVNPVNGEQLWYTKDGELTNEYNEEDKVMIGKGYQAPWQGGFGTTLSWKGLTLSVDFSWVANRWMINNDRFFEESNGLYSVYNQSKRLLYDRWKNPGDITDIPRYGETPQLDSRFLEDASFLRLKNLMLSYTLPKKWMQKTHFFDSVRAYFQAQNLATWTKFTGMDPESSANVYKAQYPATRQFTFGLEVNF